MERDRLIREMEGIVGAEGVIHEHEQLRTYECDGLIVLSRMRKILEVDIPNQRIVVEPGVINMWVSQEVADEGYYYAPDPASQIVSSIGGNLAENSGGVHCLKYGFTTNHVMGAEIVLPDGSMVNVGGGMAPDAPGYELLGAFVGSEGTLGIATKITLRIVRKPEE